MSPGQMVLTWGSLPVHPRFPSEASSQIPLPILREKKESFTSIISPFKLFFFFFFFPALKQNSQLAQKVSGDVSNISGF